MVKKFRWLSRAADLGYALRQAIDEGRIIPDRDSAVRRVAAVVGMAEDDPAREKLALELTDELESLPADAAAERNEPSGWDGIVRVLPAAAFDGEVSRSRVRGLTSAALGNKIHGAWLGRCCGCLLGQPVEGWRRDRIRGLLEATGNLPLVRYLSSDIGPELRARFDVADEGRVYGGSKKNWINNINHMPEDDDTNYTVLALKLLEQYGDAFTPADVGESWLMNMPLLHTCTAERVAYVNLASGILPPKSACRRNPYREWIGAQIRGDFFGYIRPGDPSAAAGLAFRDACISHMKNGIYGELFAAAAIAAAFVEEDPVAVVRAGLSQVPAGSRLAAAINSILASCAGGSGESDLLESIYSEWNEAEPFDWCHVIPNALIVVVAVICGGLDFTRTLGIAVEAGFDTDCNAATAGSIIGAMLGAAAIPAAWTAPLNDRLKTGIDGFDLPRISKLAERTVALARTSW